MNITKTEIWRTDRVAAGFTTDFGGAWGNNVQEDVGHYDALASDFGLAVENMVRVHQKHTDNILVADRTNGGDGILCEGASLAEDAIITNEKWLMLCIVTADCVPVFLYDEENGAIGIVHSSRLGTAKIIAPKTVLKMQEKYGTRPENIRCCFGPYLSQKHHEVELKDVEEFYKNFTAEECSRFITDSCGEPFAQKSSRETFITDSSKVPFTQKSSGVSLKYYVDMGTALRISLARVGVRPENISDLGICTFENEGMYSWRRDHNPKARILSYIVNL